MSFKQNILTKLSLRNRPIEPILIKLLVWLGVIIVWYIILTFAVDMPREYKLRHSADKMRGEYELLSERYDSLMLVLDNVAERDQNVFRKLFESNPYELESDSYKGRPELYEELADMSNAELDERLNAMRATAQLQESKMLKAFDVMRLGLSDLGTSIENIPAIQPVNNRHLTLLAAGKKPLINPFHRAMREHHGIDYLVSEGTPVFATADGKIKSLSEKNSSHGKAITIDHGNGYQTSYSHLLDIRVKKGQKVKRGDIIALSGNSGLSFAPHLHYEVIYNDTRVDPIHYFFLELSPEEYQRIIRIALSSMQSFD
ncbi:MAG: M23 family metallopeptidase [Alistipes sp.]|nr:M23 family metallopeptidase [Alistipes sp.]